MPRVKLITMGATLTALGSDSLDLVSYRRGAAERRPLSPVDLLQRVPEMGRFATVEPDRDWGHPQMRPAAASLWVEVARHIQQSFESSPDLSGVVVVHGTNVLEEFAYFLNLVLKTDRPVVVVGAQRPFNGLSSDGPMNLVSGVRVAACPEATDRGVLVVLNEQIHAARHVVKTSTYRLEAFQAPGAGAVGCVDADRVEFWFRPERLHTHRSPFDIRSLGDLPRVEILYDHAGADGGLVEAAVQLGAKGIVAAGTGAGACIGMRDALQRAAAAGVAVVRSSRVGSGRVVSTDHHGFPGAVAAGDLNPQKARVLLQVALAITGDSQKIERYFEIC